MELKPCPFCGAAPVFPDAADVYGTCYDAGCEDCGIASISIQIIDCFDWPRDNVHKSYDNETHQYGLEYIEIARQEALKAWNIRTNRDGLVLAAEIADGILNKYARYARPRSMAVAEEIKQAILKEASGE